MKKKILNLYSLAKLSSWYIMLKWFLLFSSMNQRKKIENGSECYLFIYVLKNGLYFNSDTRTKKEETQQE